MCVQEQSAVISAPQDMTTITTTCWATWLPELTQTTLCTTTLPRPLQTHLTYGHESHSNALVGSKGVCVLPPRCRVQTLLRTLPLRAPTVQRSIRLWLWCYSTWEQGPQPFHTFKVSEKKRNKNQEKRKNERQECSCQLVLRTTR